MEKIKFVTDENESVEFFVIEETKINGMNYLLVTDSDDDSDEDAAAYILKDLSKETDEEAIYEFVEDDNEMEYVSKIFTEILDDIDIEL